MRTLMKIWTFFQLTPEDEERRRRRRERNKIAATKCRLKKREKTVILVQESEILETQNQDLKSQIQELETQRRKLVDMLSMHTPTCHKHGGAIDTSYQQYAEPIPLPSYQDNFAQPALNQPQNCVTNYPVKIETYESVSDYFRQNSPYVSTSDSGCTVQSSFSTTHLDFTHFFNSFFTRLFDPFLETYIQVFAFYPSII